jgi:hypothetical protein
MYEYAGSHSTYTLGTQAYMYHYFLCSSSRTSLLVTGSTPYGTKILLSVSRKASRAISIVLSSSNGMIRQSVHTRSLAAHYKTQVTSNLQLKSEWYKDLHLVPFCSHDTHKSYFPTIL